MSGWTVVCRRDYPELEEVLVPTRIGPFAERSDADRQAEIMRADLLVHGPVDVVEEP